MSVDAYWDCPECGRTRLENPCEHCGDDELKTFNLSETSELDEIVGEWLNDADFRYLYEASIVRSGWRIGRPQRV